MNRFFSLAERPFAQAIKGVARRKKERRMSRNSFYMKYPYRHKLSILAANKRGAVDLPAKIFFNRVPKSTNTTVTFATAKICGKNMERGRDVKSSFMRPSEINLQKMSKFDDCFKFTFVRDPYV